MAKKKATFPDIVAATLKEFNQTKYINQWQKDNTTRLYIRLNNHTDSDIISKLESVESKSGYIKKLIREDIEKNFI